VDLSQVSTWLGTGLALWNRGPFEVDLERDEKNKTTLVGSFISENGIVAVLGDENQFVVGDSENQMPPLSREGAYGSLAV
jgi:hypothetical protein